MLLKIQGQSSWRENPEGGFVAGFSYKGMEVIEFSRK
jgi:hypothetical protein